MQKIVVIGSNSFSGQDFIALLLEEPSLEVIGVSRSPEKPGFMLRYASRKDLSHYSFHQVDMNGGMVQLLELLDRERPDAIVNFAAQSEVAPSWEHPEHWFETNCAALSKLVNHLRRQDYLERYLHISSPEAYGSCIGRVTETTPDNPSTPYAASKAAADMIVDVYRKQYGFPALTVRATNVYGARQQLFKIVPRSAIYMRLGRKIPLHGGGVAVKSYIHVRDVSRGELAILKKGKIGERYHLAPEEGISVRDIVAKVAENLGQAFEDVVDIVDERPGQDAAYVIDAGKAHADLGWAPEISQDAGIKETVDWVVENWADIQRQSLDYIHKP